MYRSHGLRGNTAVDALRTLADIETQIVQTQNLASLQALHSQAEARETMINQ